MGLDGKPSTLHDGHPLLVHVGNSLQRPDEKEIVPESVLVPIVSVNYVDNCYSCNCVKFL